MSQLLPTNQTWSKSDSEKVFQEKSSWRSYRNCSVFLESHRCLGSQASLCLMSGAGSSYAHVEWSRGRIDDATQEGDPIDSQNNNRVLPRENNDAVALRMRGCEERRDSLHLMSGGGVEERIGYQAGGFELRWSRRISGAGVCWSRSSRKRVRQRGGSVC